MTVMIDKLDIVRRYEKLPTAAKAVFLGSLFAVDLLRVRQWPEKIVIWFLGCLGITKTKIASYMVATAISNQDTEWLSVNDRLFLIHMSKIKGGFDQNELGRVAILLEATEDEFAQ